MYIIFEDTWYRHGCLSSIGKGIGIVNQLGIGISISKNVQSCMGIGISMVV